MVKEMLFNSPLFLFVFSPIMLAVYFTVNRKYKNFVLLFSSLVFYAWAEPRFIWVLLGSALLDYWLGQIIANNEKRIAKLAMIIGIIGNVGILGYFKYTNFLMDNLNHILLTINSSFSLPVLQILLPVGVSFVVFEKITYLVDIYRQVGKTAPGILNYLVYVFLFPKLLAGPIVKYHDIEDQLVGRSETLKDIVCGVKRFCYGLAKKVFIADTMGEMADLIFALPANEIGFGAAWLGAICFTLQIYFDFSGYSDMAIGLCRIFGFRILENFRTPYISKNFTEFWRRWHISLSTWIRDYLYISMGGNRVTRSRMYFNLWVCFLLSGLWHGASWTFVVWGAYHGFFLIMDKLFWLDMQKRLPSIINWTITMLFVIVGWVIFRADSIHQAWSFVLTMLNPWAQTSQLIYVPNNVWFFIVVGIVLSLAPILPRIKIINQKAEVILKYGRQLELGLVVVIFLITITKISAVTFNPFLYFRF